MITAEHIAAAIAHAAAAAAHETAARIIADQPAGEDEDTQATNDVIADHIAAAEAHRDASRSHERGEQPSAGRMADIETHGTIGDSTPGEHAIEATARAIDATEAAAS